MDSVVGKKALTMPQVKKSDLRVAEVVRMNMIAIDSEIGEARELAKACRSATVKICVDVIKSAPRLPALGKHGKVCERTSKV